MSYILYWLSSFVIVLFQLPKCLKSSRARLVRGSSRLGLIFPENEILGSASITKSLGSALLTSLNNTPPSIIQ